MGSAELMKVEMPAQIKARKQRLQSRAHPAKLWALSPRPRILVVFIFFFPPDRHENSH